MRYIIIIILILIINDNALYSKSNIEFEINDTINVNFELIDSIYFINSYQNIQWNKFKEMNINNKAKTLDSLLKSYYSNYINCIILNSSITGEFNPLKFQKGILNIDTNINILFENNKTFIREVKFISNFFSNYVNFNEEIEYFILIDKSFIFLERINLVYLDKTSKNILTFDTSIFYWMIISLIHETKDYKIINEIDLTKLFKIEKYFSSFYFNPEKKIMIYDFLLKHRK